MRIGSNEQGTVYEVPRSIRSRKKRTSEGGYGSKRTSERIGVYLFVKVNSSMEMSTSSAFLIDSEGSVVATMGTT